MPALFQGGNLFAAQFDTTTIHYLYHPSPPRPVVTVIGGMDHHAGQGQIVFSANALPVVAPSWTDILFLSSRHSESYVAFPPASLPSEEIDMSHLRSIWKSELLAPAYLSLLSIALLLLRSLVASEWFKKLWAHIRHHNKEGDIDAEADIDESVIRTHAGILADVKSHVKAGGGCIVFGWKLLRLAGCLALVGLTIATLVIDEGNRESSVIDIWKHKKGKGKKKKKDVPVSDEFTNEEWVHVALCLTYVRFGLCSITYSCPHSS